MGTLKDPETTPMLRNRGKTCEDAQGGEKKKISAKGARTQPPVQKKTVSEGLKEMRRYGGRLGLRNQKDTPKK